MKRFAPAYRAHEAGSCKTAESSTLGGYGQPAFSRALTRHIGSPSAAATAGRNRRRGISACETRIGVISQKRTYGARRLAHVRASRVLSAPRQCSPRAGAVFGVLAGRGLYYFLQNEPSCRECGVLGLKSQRGACESVPT